MSAGCAPFEVSTLCSEASLTGGTPYVTPGILAIGMVVGRKGWLGVQMKRLILGLFEAGHKQHVKLIWPFYK